MQLGVASKLVLLVVAAASLLVRDVLAGGASQLWTRGRRAERVCSFEGYYSVPGATTTQPCPGSMPCPPGSFCTCVRARCFGGSLLRGSLTLLLETFAVVASDGRALLVSMERRKACALSNARLHVRKDSSARKERPRRSSAALLIGTAPLVQHYQSLCPRGSTR
jgi:hypothetical protein